MPKDQKPKKHKKKPVKALTAFKPGIGVVSSILCEASFQSAFEQAVATAGVNLAAPPTYYDEIILKHNGDFKTAIVNLNKDNSIGLIVTFGGMVAYNAANTFATTPFLSLCGAPPAGLPTPGVAPLPPNYFYGGVGLESYALNPARIAHLGAAPHKFAPSDITLLYHPKSALAHDELANWKGGPVLAKGDNLPANYVKAFSAISTSAVIVSADPVFLAQREDLIKAANDSYAYVCYPLHNYRNSTGTPPASGRSTIYGPRLEDGIRLIGEMAATVISKGLPAADEVFIRLGAPIDL